MKEKILILVKTYPTPSKSYVETVCTAGVKEDGSWVRIFPVPYRSNYEKYKEMKKYRWVTCNLYKSEKDSRPESYHLDGFDFEFKEMLSSKNAWEARRRAILKKVKIFTRKEDLLLAAKKNMATLAVFKPTHVEIVCRKAKNYDNAIKKSAKYIQGDLFISNEWNTDFKYAEPLPYEFQYRVTDDAGNIAVYKILDWEIGALFRKEKERLGSNEKARDAVKSKYESFLDTERYELYLYLGTLLQFQRKRVANPWTIVGVAPFPRQSQGEFDFG